MNSGKALIIEDIREAEMQLRAQGYECERIIYNELLSSYALPPKRQQHIGSAFNTGCKSL